MRGEVEYGMVVKERDGVAYITDNECPVGRCTDRGMEVGGDAGPRGSVCC